MKLKYIFAILLRKLVKIKRFMINYVHQLLIKLAYPEVRFAQGVLLESGVYIRVTDGGVLLIEEDVTVGRNAILIVEEHGRMEIGAHTYIGPNTVLGAIEHISIGEDCLIAEGVTIRDQNHGIEIGEQPFRLQPPTSATITIENNVWLGAKSTVLKGVNIGKNTVVGANAVVTRNLPENAIAVGIPAKVINSTIKFFNNNARNSPSNQNK